MTLFHLKLITFHSEICQSLSDVAVNKLFSGFKCHICPPWSLPSAAVPVSKVSVYFNTLYLPLVQTHFALFHPLKSRRRELIQMSATKQNCILKWTLKAFAFELFIGTRSLISLKSPLIHFSVSLWPVCCCACVSVCVLCVFSCLTTGYLMVASQEKFPSLKSRAERG